MGVFITENDKVRDADDVSLAEKILQLRNEKKDHWGVIDLLVQAWVKKTPEDVEAFKIQIDDYRESLVDKKFGQTKGGKDQERRLTLVFPQRLLMMIRTVYKPEELEMDKEFYRDFLKRYPNFRVAESN